MKINNTACHEPKRPLRVEDVKQGEPFNILDKCFLDHWRFNDKTLFLKTALEDARHADDFKELLKETFVNLGTGQHFTGRESYEVRLQPNAEVVNT